MTGVKLKILTTLLCVTTTVFADNGTPSPQQEERDKILSLTALAVVYRDWQSPPTSPQSRGHNIGSILVNKDHEPVFWARNSANITDNGSQHGEVRLIQNFLNCNNIGKYANGYTVYTSLEPCAMCTGLMTLTRVSRVVYVQADPGYGHARDALKKINYPNVFEQYTPETLEQKITLESEFSNYTKTKNDLSITNYLLTSDAKAVFSTAEKSLSEYRVLYSENRATLESAQKFLRTVPGANGDNDLSLYCPNRDNSKQSNL